MDAMNKAIAVTPKIRYRLREPGLACAGTVGECAISERVTVT
jgi:hypothetical protein